MQQSHMYYYDRVVSPSLRPSVCSSVTHWHWVKTTQARITKSSPTDSPSTLVLAIKSSSRNSKGFTGSEGVRWELGKKNSQKRCKIGPQFLLLMTNRKLHTVYALPIGAKINDLGWPWMADTHCCRKDASFGAHYKQESPANARVTRDSSSCIPPSWIFEIRKLRH